MAWQHPSLPWVDLIHRGPRVAIKDSAGFVSSVNANSYFRESLFTHWIDSFRSLFQVIFKNQNLNMLQSNYIYSSKLDLTTVHMHTIVFFFWYPLKSYQYSL